jgi:cell division protease FtsH
MFKDKKYKYTAYYAVAVIVLLLLLNYVLDSLKTGSIDYKKFTKLLNEKKVSQVYIGKDKLTIIPKANSGEDKKQLITGKIEDPDLINKLEASGAVYGMAPEDNSSLINIFTNWIIPIILFLLIGKLFFGKLDKKFGSGVMSFGKNTAKLYAESETGKTFQDVAGQEEAKESLIEIVDFLHNPERYTDIGAKLPKGALLVGPPGTGKTLLAKAVAGEAKVPFFSLSGSSFVEMFVGMGASRVSDLFKQAEEKAPCIIFIDEIDAIGKSRDIGYPGGNDEREQTLNQLLAEMDGFDSSKGVVIIAATNRPEVLDKALLRPGRFDRRIIVDRPDLKGREAILRVHVRDVKVEDTVDLEAIARSTPGAVGSDLANIVNEAALMAVKDSRKTVIQEDLLEAVEVIIAGKEKKDRIMSPKEKKIVAFHEVGHALVSVLLKDSDAIHKITIVPRTMGALGYTMQLPTEEKYLISKEELYNKIVILLGGRSAEEVEFNLVSTGAANDIEKATETARSMVTTYGMSDKFDMMGIETKTNPYLDGNGVIKCSPATEKEIDDEILGIIISAHKTALKLLEENKDILGVAAENLIEKETLTGTEFMEILKNRGVDLNGSF